MRIERGYYREDDIGQKLFETVEYVSDLEATGLAYRENPIVASYNKVGNMVFISLYVECDKFRNGSNTFTPGTGSFTCTLPFPAIRHASIWGGMYHDISTGKRHVVVGQIEQGSNILSFEHLNNQVEVIPLDHNNPVTMAAADWWHLEGWYEAENSGVTN